jgi:hypothetical protein
MIKTASSGKDLKPETELQQKSLPEKLATLLAFVSVFIFFFKILFF